MGKAENDVQEGILTILKANHLYVWRQNNMSAPGRTFRGLKGVSDVIGLLPGGRFLAIEAKRPGVKKGSEHQEAFIAEINERGGFAFVADSVQTVVDKFKTIGINLCSV